MQRLLNKKNRRRLPILLVSCLLLCKESAQEPLPEPELDRNAEITELFLSVQVNKQPASPGQIVRAGSLIEVGRDSFCKLLVKTEGSDITFILHANTRLQIVPRSSDGKLETLLSGRLDIEVKDKGPYRTVHINTPLASTTVQGTRLRVDSVDKQTAVTVYTGKVSVRPRIAELENLPPAARKNCETCSIVAATLEKDAVEVTAGKRTTVDTSARRALAQASPALRAIMADTTLQQTDEILSDEEGQRIVQRINQRGQTDTSVSPARIRQELNSVPQLRSSVRDINQQEAQEWGQRETTPAQTTTPPPVTQAPAPVAVQPQPEPVAQPQPEPAAQPQPEPTAQPEPVAEGSGSALLDRLKAAHPGKPIYMFRLADGSSVIGAITGDSGSAYTVGTSSGSRLVPKDSVEGKTELGP